MEKMTRDIIVCLMFVASSAFADSNMESWIRNLDQVSRTQILRNISPPGTMRGTVIASPSRQDPDYYYHWVRDASLVLLAVRESRVEGDALVNSHLVDFVRLTAYQQSQSERVNPTRPNYGEPKYNVDGSPYTGPWGRPQNDGPALRAILLSEWAIELLNNGNRDYVVSNLYDSQLPSRTVLKKDLEYVAHNWFEANYDLWEEVKGDHFFTLMVSRKSLLIGAELAKRLGDRGAGDYYEMQAARISQRLQRFYNSNKGYIEAVQDFVEGHEYKISNLDSAVLLGSIHGDMGDGFFTPSTTEVLQTLNKLAEQFKQIYTVNNNGLRGIAFGRYPEDRYYGGNPWFITTFAAAEVLYRAGQYLSEVSFELYQRIGDRKVLVALKRGTEEHRKVIEQFGVEAERILERAKHHSPANLRLTEQFDRNTGSVKAAPDLTWSYASFLTVSRSRERYYSSLHRLSD